MIYIYIILYIYLYYIHIIVIKKDQQLQVAFLGDQDQKEAASLRFARGTSQGFDASPYNEDIANKLLGRIMIS